MKQANRSFLLLLVAALSVTPALAQETPPDTASETTATTTEESAALGWTWSSRFEGGWRQVELSGSESLYRTVVDENEGLRLFSFDVSGTRGLDRGTFADTFKVSGFGWGGDADQRLQLKLARRGAYSVDLDFGRNRQVYDVPSWQLGQHSDDRVRRNAGVTVNIFPKKGRAWISYRAEELEGPGTTTQRQGGNQFLLDQQLDRDSNDLRVGGQIPAGPVTITLEQAFRKTSGRSDYSLAAGAADGNQGSSTLDHYDRSTDDDARTNVSRASLQVPFASRVDFTASYVYADGAGDTQAHRDMLQTRPGPAGGIQRLLDSDGSLDRLARLAEAGITVHLTKRLMLDDTYRWRRSTSTGDLDVLTTTITNGNPTTTTAAYLQRYIEDANENSLDLLWRGGNGVNVRGGVRTASRTLSWEDDEPGEVDRDDTRWFVGTSWRPGSKIHVQGEFESGDGDTHEADPKLLARTLPLDYWSAGARLQVTPDKSTNIGFSAKYRTGDNPTPSEKHDDELVTFAVQGSHAWGDKGEIRGSLSTGRHDVSTLLDITQDGDRIQPTQDYEYRNTTFTLEGIARPTSRIDLSLRFQDSDTSGTYPTRWQRIEPRVSFKAFDHLDLTVGWYRDKYDRPADVDEDFQASGIVTWLTWAWGPDGWDGRYREKKP